jgi:hypothetical protein
MQVYKNISHGQFNNEGLYKLKGIELYLNNYNLTNQLSFDSLASFSKSIAFKAFLNDYQSSVIDNLRSLAHTALIDHNFPDFDILMGFTADGGSLASFVSAYDNYSYRFDSEGLVKLVLTTPPQAFILNSGLRPTPQAASLYVSLVRDVIESFPDVIAEVIDASTDAERKRLYVALLSLCNVAGIKDLKSIPITKRPDQTALLGLASEPIEGTTVSSHLHALIRHSSFTSGTQELGENLSSFFLTYAFEQCLKIEDTDELINQLKARATAWAFHLKCPKSHHKDFVNQLLATALMACPQHFKQAGYCDENLMGFHTKQALVGLVKIVCDGPMGMLINAEDDQNKILNALEYLHELAPHFSLTELYENTGFNHSQSVCILRAIGGYCPGVERAIAEKIIEPEQAVSVLSVLRATDSYDKYSAKSLDHLMSNYITRLPKRSKAGARQPMVCLEFPKDMQSRVRQEFARAYTSNQEFKQLFIKRVERTLGITSDHLSMFNLSHSDVPRTMARMHRKERGSRLEDELGM